MQSGLGKIPRTKSGIFSVLLVSMLSGIGLPSVNTVTSNTEREEGAY